MCASSYAAGRQHTHTHTWGIQAQVPTRTDLLEAYDTREACERAGELVAVQHAKVGEAERQVAVRVRAVLEYEAVARTVHRLQAHLLLLLRLREVLLLGGAHGKHVVLVVLPVPRRLPQLLVVHHRRDDLLYAPHVS